MVLIPICFQTGIIGETLLVRSSSPNPSSRTSSLCRNAHFHYREMSIPASVRVSWKGLGGTVFTQRRFPQFYRFECELVSEDSSKRTEDWHAVEKFWKHPELCC